MNFLVRNNVKTTVSRPIATSDTVIFINKASSPFRNPPQPQPDHILRLTLSFSDNSSVLLELVDVLEMEDIGTEWRLTVERAVTEDEDLDQFSLPSVARSFPVGSLVYLANTASGINSRARKNEVVLVKKVRVNEDGIEDLNGEFVRVASIDSGQKEIVLFTYEI